jgi:pre-mRNA-processing factor 6
MPHGSAPIPPKNGVGRSDPAVLNALVPPPGYVPGAGRGAVGFTTRSDIGPSDATGAGNPSGGNAPAALMQQQLQQAPDADEAPEEAPEEDATDAEAEQAYASIDEYMAEKRKRSRPASSTAQSPADVSSNANAHLSEQFADIKRQLRDVSEQEWNAIPDIGDTSAKKQKRTAYVPPPDSLLAKAAAEKQVASTLDGALPPQQDSNARSQQTSNGNAHSDGAATDLTAVGEGRGTVLGLKLDRMADSVSGQTVVDPKSYMSGLQSMRVSSDAEVSDIKKARLLLKSVIGTNPSHAPGWIAAARLEELAGKVQTARKYIQQGTEHCPQNEDVWLEASRLQNNDNAKAVLARAVANLPQSVKLWMQAAQLEETNDRKKKVLRRGLEQCPNSVRLWKALVELSSEEDARVLLYRAVECCPQHVELWLALARLESYENARKVLNKARETVPTEPTIWITAAKLEEANGNEQMVGKILPRALKSLQSHSVVIDRDWWLKEAESCEKSDPPSFAVCRAIVDNVVGFGVEQEDKKRTWLGDAQEFMKKGSIRTARAMYRQVCEEFASHEDVWLEAAELERNHFDRESLDELLQRAVTNCPHAEDLWLMAAKERWLNGNVKGARQVLKEAFQANPQSEEVWLAAFKLEFENYEFERARALIRKATESSADGGTERMWMKAAIVERHIGNEEEEARMLDKGLELHPGFFKLWLMRGQQHERNDRVKEARETYLTGARQCPQCVPLWRSLASLEERNGNVSRARALLEQARLKVPKNEELWLASVRMERRSGNERSADAVMAKALQELPKAGKLWAESVKMTPKAKQKSKSVDALRNCDNDPSVVSEIAFLFWQDRKTQKARAWMNRAVTLSPGTGDLWAAYYWFEREQGTESSRKEVEERCEAAEPRHGERWQRVSKQVASGHKGVKEVLKEVVEDFKQREAP